MPETRPVMKCAASRFSPGSVLAGRYRLEYRLGRGGMGEVYRAEDLRLGQQVALKFMSPTWEQDPAVRQRFLDEVRFARRVSHANVCRVYDVGEADGPDSHRVSGNPGRRSMFGGSPQPPVAGASACASAPSPTRNRWMKSAVTAV